LISRELQLYNFSTIGAADAYGQPQASTEPVGQVKMAIYTTTQGTQDNVNYSGANYLGLTNDSVEDTYIIHYGAERLKVLYIQPKGRYKQVFMVKV
jgi:hypothetical protein